MTTTIDGDTLIADDKTIVSRYIVVIVAIAFFVFTLLSIATFTILFSLRNCTLLQIVVTIAHNCNNYTNATIVRIFACYVNCLTSTASYVNCRTSTANVKQ